MRSWLRASWSTERAMLVVSLATLLWAGVAGAGAVGDLVDNHPRLVLAFLAALALGELGRVRMPGGRLTAPVATASAMALAFTALLSGESPFASGTSLVVLVASLGSLLGLGLRLLWRREVAAYLVQARILGAAVVAALDRGLLVDGRSLWQWQVDPTRSIPLVAAALVLASGVGVYIEVVLAALVRAEREHAPARATLRDDLGEAQALTISLVTAGPLTALLAPVLGLAALPFALFPMMLTFIAVQRYAANQATLRQMIATLSRLTEAGGYAPLPMLSASLRSRWRWVARWGSPSASCATWSMRRSCTTSARSRCVSRSPGVPPSSPPPTTSAGSRPTGPGSCAGRASWTMSPRSWRSRRPPTGWSASWATRCPSPAGSSRSPTPTRTSPEAPRLLRERASEPWSASTSGWATSTTRPSSTPSPGRCSLAPVDQRGAGCPAPPRPARSPRTLWGRGLSSIVGGRHAPDDDRHAGRADAVDAHQQAGPGPGDGWPGPGQGQGSVRTGMPPTPSRGPAGPDGRAGVVFDLDGTLVDSEPYWVRGFTSGLSTILAHRGYGTHRLEPGEMVRFQGGRVPDSVRAILDSLRLPLARITDQVELDGIVAEVVDSVTAEFVAAPTPIPAVVRGARELHRQGVPLAIASSSPAGFIDAVVGVLDLAAVFPVRVSAVGLPLGKPDPSVYRLTLGALSARAELSVAVEDSAVGVLAAVRAGLRCLWLLPAEDAEHPSARVAELTGLAVRAGGGAPSRARIEEQVRMSSTVDPGAVIRILDELRQEARRP